jgi:mycothiol synthase
MPKLQDTVAGWIAEAGRCGYDHIGELPHRIYENLRGRLPIGEVVQLWDDADGLAGIAITMRMGVVFDVFAAPRLRGAESEREMLQAAFETTARLMSADEPFVLTDVFDCDTERIRLLTELGFEHFRNWEDVRECDLTETIPDAGLDAGPSEDFVVRGARLDDADHLAIARNDCFGATWTGEQYRSEVMEKPGYDPSREIVAEAADGRIAAFAVYWTDFRNKIGHFEPVGTHSGFQRRGLARIVMLHAMRQMQELGMTKVTVNHLTENVQARKLYESIGFIKRHETLGFRLARPSLIEPAPGHGVVARQ